MTSRPQQLTLPPPRSYTRTDFAALRAFVQRAPPATIARLYYDPESAPHAASPDGLERHLRAMRDDLVHLAQLHGSPVLADHLKASARQHGSAKLASRGRDRGGSAALVAPPVSALRRGPARLPAGRLWRSARLRASATYARRPDDGRPARTARLGWAARSIRRRFALPT